MTEEEPKITFHDAEDDSCDLIVQFSNGFMLEQGWEVGESFRLTREGQTLTLKYLPKLAPGSTAAPGREPRFCDVCGREGGGGEHSFQLGSVMANWCADGSHPEENYRLILCRACFYQTLAGLREERRALSLFSEDGISENTKLWPIHSGEPVGKP